MAFTFIFKNTAQKEMAQLAKAVTWWHEQEASTQSIKPGTEDCWKQNRQQTEHYARRCNKTLIPNQDSLRSSSTAPLLKQCSVCSSSTGHRLEASSKVSGFAKRWENGVFKTVLHLRENYLKYSKDFSSMCNWTFLLIFFISANGRFLSAAQTSHHLSCKLHIQIHSHSIQTTQKHSSL